MHRDDTLRLFLYAARKDKVCRLISEGHTPADGEDLVDRIDRERADFLRRYFKAEWPNRPVHQAMFNTALRAEAVIQLILTLLRETQ